MKKSQHEPWSDEWLADMYPCLQAASWLQFMINHNALCERVGDAPLFSKDEIDSQRKKLAILRNGGGE